MRAEDRDREREGERERDRKMADGDSWRENNQSMRYVETLEK